MTDSTILPRSTISSVPDRYNSEISGNFVVHSPSVVPQSSPFPQNAEPPPAPRLEVRPTPGTQAGGGTTILGSQVQPPPAPTRATEPTPVVVPVVVSEPAPAPPPAPKTIVLISEETPPPLSLGAQHPLPPEVKPPLKIAPQLTLLCQSLLPQQKVPSRNPKQQPLPRMPVLADLPAMPQPLRAKGFLLAKKFKTGICRN